MCPYDSEVLEPDPLDVRRLHPFPACYRWADLETSQTAAAPGYLLLFLLFLLLHFSHLIIFVIYGLSTTYKKTKSNMRQKGLK